MGGSSRSALPHVFASQRDLQAVPLHLRSRASGCPHATKADPPPPIWPSASPLAPRVGPSLKLQRLFRATTSLAIKAQLASSPTFAEPLLRQFVGLRKGRNPSRPFLETCGVPGVCLWSHLCSARQEDVPPSYTFPLSACGRKLREMRFHYLSFRLGCSARNARRVRGSRCRMLRSTSAFPPGKP